MMKRDLLTTPAIPKPYRNTETLSSIFILSKSQKYQQDRKRQIGGLKMSGESVNTTTDASTKHNQRLTYAKQQIFSFQISCEISYPKAFPDTLV